MNLYQDLPSPYDHEDVAKEVDRDSLKTIDKFAEYDRFIVASSYG